MGSPSNAGATARATTPQGDSPERLGRELRPVFTEGGFQPVPTPLWRLPPTYFPPSSPLKKFYRCALNSLQNAGFVKGRSGV